MWPEICKLHLKESVVELLQKAAGNLRTKREYGKLAAYFSLCLR